MADTGGYAKIGVMAGAAFLTVLGGLQVRDRGATSMRPGKLTMKTFRPTPPGRLRAIWSPMRRRVIRRSCPKRSMCMQANRRIFNDPRRERSPALPNFAKPHRAARQAIGATPFHQRAAPITATAPKPAPPEPRPSTQATPAMARIWTATATALRASRIAGGASFSPSDPRHHAFPHHRQPQNPPF